MFFAAHPAGVSGLDLVEGGGYPAGRRRIPCSVHVVWVRQMGRVPPWGGGGVPARVSRLPPSTNRIYPLTPAG